VTRAAAENDPFIGKTLNGAYRVEERIASGGMGVVYRAVHVALEAPVAVKVMRKALFPEPTAIERLRREARAASKLRHPNIVAVTDFGQDDDGTFFIVMEYVPGKSLARVIAKQAPLPVRRVVHIGSQILAALGEAHAGGILHRDVKPDNVLLESQRLERDLVKVLDFGNAREFAGGARLTQPGMVCGTPEYMSPEQARGEVLDARSDLYSAGVVLFEMLTGEPPGTSRPAEVLRLALGRETPLEALVLRAISNDPHERPESADEMRDALKACTARAEGLRFPEDEPGATEILPEERSVTGSRTTGRTTLDPAIVQTIERQASAILGPIAQYLVKRGSARASNETELCEAVATLIDSEEDRAKFLKVTRAERRVSESRPVSRPVTPHRPRPNLDPSVLERVRADLTLYVGPVAHLVLQRACDQAETTEELLHLLSLEIPSPADREAFRRSLSGTEAKIGSAGKPGAA